MAIDDRYGASIIVNNENIVTTFKYPRLQLESNKSQEAEIDDKHSRANNENKYKKA